VWRLDADGERTLLAEDLRGPVNGLHLHGDALFVSEGGHPGRISRLSPDGNRTTVLDDLPGPGSYHTNMAVVGPDDKLYFSQGSLTNLGVVGLDAYAIGWLRRLPHGHDIAGYPVTLAGVNVTTPDPTSDDPQARATTGGFSPFGTPTKRGQQVAAGLPATAAVMRAISTGPISSSSHGGFATPMAWGSCPTDACWPSTRAPTTAAVAPSATHPTCCSRCRRAAGTAGRTSLAPLVWTTRGSCPSAASRRRCC
jgi:hypothetical protein